MEDDEQGPGKVVGAEHADTDSRVISQILDCARAVAASSDDAAAARSVETLEAALQQASPDERSTAAKELTDDRAAYAAMHDALRDLGIEP